MVAGSIGMAYIAARALARSPQRAIKLIARSSSKYRGRLRVGRGEIVASNRRFDLLIMRSTRWHGVTLLIGVWRIMAAGDGMYGAYRK